MTAFLMSHDSGSKALVYWDSKHLAPDIAYAVLNKGHTGLCGREQLLAAPHGLPHVVTARLDPHSAPLFQLAEAIGHFRRDSPSPCVSAFGSGHNRQLRGGPLCPASVPTDSLSPVSALGRPQPTSFVANPRRLGGAPPSSARVSLATPTNGCGLG